MLKIRASAEGDVAQSTHQWLQLRVWVHRISSIQNRGCHILSIVQRK